MEKDIKNGKYTTKLKIPKDPKRECKRCNKVFLHGDNFCSRCGRNVGMDYFEALKKNKKDFILFSQDKKRLLESFKQDLFKTFDLPNDRISEIIFQEVLGENRKEGFLDHLSFFYCFGDLLSFTTKILQEVGIVME